MRAGNVALVLVAELLPRGGNNDVSVLVWDSRCVVVSGSSEVESRHRKLACQVPGIRTIS